MNAIEARGVEKSFGKARVLRGVDLDVAPGEILCLLGKNGAGKTTMIRILTTLLRPDAGTVSLFGVDALREPARARTLFGLTGQAAAVDDMLTGRENLVLMARLRHMPKPKAVADELLDRFALSDAAKKLAGAYSGGMRRRLDLAMGLIGNPPLLFLDEPTTGLDPESRIALWGEVKSLRAAGAAILLTTQHLEEADMLADRVAVLAGGTIATVGTARDLKVKFARGEIEASFRDEASCRAAAARLAAFETKIGGANLVVETGGDAASVGEALCLLAGEGLVSFDARPATLEDAYLDIVSKEEVS